jgi:hypothetical protein
MSNLDYSSEHSSNAEESNILEPKVQYIKKAQCARYLAFSMWIIEKLPIEPENKVAALEAMRIFDSGNEQMEFFNTFDEKENKKIIADLVKERKKALKPATVRKPRAPKKPKQTETPNVASDASDTSVTTDASDASDAPVTTDVSDAQAKVQKKNRKPKKSEIIPTNAPENIVIQHEIEHINPIENKNVPITKEDVPEVINQAENESPTTTKEDVPEVPVVVIQPQAEIKNAEPEKKKTKTQKKIKPNAENTSSTTQKEIKPKTPIKKNTKSKTSVPNLNIQNIQPIMVDGKFIPQSPRDPPPKSTSNPNIQPAGELTEEKCDDEEEEDEGENEDVSHVTINGRMLYKTADGRYLEILSPHNEVFNIHE